jgi:hypothetical protein
MRPVTTLGLALVLATVAGPACAHDHDAFLLAGAVEGLIVAAAEPDPPPVELVSSPPPGARCTVVSRFEARDPHGSYVGAAELVKTAARAARLSLAVVGKHTRPTPSTLILPAMLLSCD